MSKLAQESNAINLSQGFPDFEIDSKLIELTHEAMLNGHNQYAPMPGHPLLTHRLAEKIKSLYNKKLEPSKEITVTSGATEALLCTIQALVHFQDEVIILEPAYDSYIPVVELCGAKPVIVELSAPEYKVDWNKVASKITSKTKMIIVNTPHNPTGAIFSQQDLDALEKIALQHGIFVLSDEVYEHLTFEQKHASILSRPNLAEQAIAVYSFGKVLHATGWKLGYLVASDSVTNEIRKVHQFATFSSPTPMQIAIASYLEDPDTYLELGNFFQKKRDLFQEGMQESRFELLPCNGTYFQSASYKNISDIADLEFAKELTIKHKVAAVPMSAFYQSGKDEKVLRFCFAKKEETLLKAAEILCRI